MLKAKKSGQLPSAFGEIILPGIDDDTFNDGQDSTAISNHDTQKLPKRNENGMQGKNPSPKVSVTSQSGAKPNQPGGQQPLRSVQGFRRHFKQTNTISWISK